MLLSAPPRPPEPPTPELQHEDLRSREEAGDDLETGRGRVHV